MAKTKKAPTLVSEHGQWTPTPTIGKPPPPGTSGTWTPQVPTVTPGTPAIPAYVPDYEALVKGDPIYQQTMANLQAHGVQSAAERKANTDRALIEFGEVPNMTDAVNGLGLDPNSSMYKMLFGDVDQQTSQGAKDLTAAGLSTTARLGTAHKTALQNLIDTLAARGTLRSGATGVGTGLENQNYLGAQFDARNNLLTYLSGVQSAFNQAQQADQAAGTTAAGDATQRQIQEHPATAAVAAVPGTDANGNPPVNSSGSPGDRDGLAVPTPPAIPPPPTIAQKAYNKLNMGSFTQ